LPRNCLLKHLIEEKIGGRTDVKGRREKDVSRYWIKLCNKEDIGNWKRKHYIVSGVFIFKEATYHS
jgi:hypothetical protein